MGLTHDQIDDLVLLTQRKLIRRGAFVNMQTDLTDHVAVREMWKGRKKKFDGGLDWTFEVQMDHNHSARAVGLYEIDGSGVHDTMVEGKVGPRHVNSNYIYDKREQVFQRGGVAVASYIHTKYTAMMVSFWELLERFLWGKPTDSSDKKTPYGIAYWVTRAATEGFNGGNPAGFTEGRAGIDTNAYPRWANWTGQYSQVNKTDLVRKMRKAHRKTKFRSPVMHAEPRLGSMKNGIYTNDAVIGLLEEVLEDQNMNLGNDLASKDGRSLFKGTPIIYVPYLDNDTADPLYMLDWKWLAVGVLSGWENNLQKPVPVPNRHLVMRVDLDATLNMVCTDLRRQTVFYK